MKHAATIAVLLIAFPANAWDPIGDVGRAANQVVQGAGNVVQQAGQAVGNLGNAVGQGLQGAGNAIGGALQQGGQAVGGIGGDGAQFVGQVLGKAGDVATKVGEASATLAAAGVLKPTGQFVQSLGTTTTALADIDLRHPETIANVIQNAAGAAAGLVVSAERTAERTAADLDDLAIEALPEPLEHGVRHASAEVIKELEKRNPELARVLRIVPTSIIYNHLRLLGAEEETCDPGGLAAELRATKPNTLDATAKWASIATTPLGKGLGISGWTVTPCRATVVGILDGDAAYSGDNIVTIDLRIVSIAIGGQHEASGTNKTLRVEVLPVGRAHQIARFHELRSGETIMTSGKLVHDEDGHWLELHPVDDLEILAVPKSAPTAKTPPTTTAHLVAPGRYNDTLRFTVYVVRPGDSLATIAEQYYGLQHWPIIAAANQGALNDPDTIHPGQRLNIPIRTKDGAAATQPPS